MKRPSIELKDFGHTDTQDVHIEGLDEGLSPENRTSAGLDSERGARNLLNQS